MAITFKVKEVIGVLGKRKNNSLELRVISWNGNPAKYDIRGWYEYNGEERCSKGFTFSEFEIRSLYNIIEPIDFSEKENYVLGTIPQSGNYCIKVIPNEYGFNIVQYNGNFGIKRVNLNAEEMEKLRELLSERIGEEPINAPDEPENEEGEEDTEPTSSYELYRDKDENENIIHNLTAIPVNDVSYPLNKANAEQLREAIKRMEADKNGHHKTRLTRCKAKLKQLESKESYAKEVEKLQTPKEVPAKVTTTKVAEKVTTETAKTPAKKAEIIEFPKKDTTEIVRLKPTGENHTYEEVEEKLNKERQMFNGDSDTDYVIDGLLEHCNSDQEFLDNVMRPDKSYMGALQYFANKAKDGYGTKVNLKGGYGVMMNADTALKYAIDYFNSEEPKPEPKPEPKEVRTVTKATTKSTKKTTAKKSAPRKTTKAWRKRK